MRVYYIFSQGVDSAKPHRISVRSVTINRFDKSCADDNDDDDDDDDDGDEDDDDDCDDNDDADDDKEKVMMTLTMTIATAGEQAGTQLAQWSLAKTLLLVRPVSRSTFLIILILLFIFYEDPWTKNMAMTFITTITMTMMFGHM